jgi:TetR/AcrR family transcriptional repressor of nem operon
MPGEKQFDVDEVLDKAMQAFWSRGYEATSMQDLVDRTGINRASLYSTYRDKHALFLAALRMYDNTLRRKRLAVLEAEYGPREAIRQLFLAFTSKVTAKGANRGCFLTNTALELAAHDPGAARIVAHAQAQFGLSLESRRNDSFPRALGQRPESPTTRKPWQRPWLLLSPENRHIPPRPAV